MWAAYKTINWESIVLIAAMLPMSLALEKTGSWVHISNSLVSELGTYGPLALMAEYLFHYFPDDDVLSQHGYAVLLTLSRCKVTQIGVSQYLFFCGDTVGKYVFQPPFSANALVMPAGQYTFMDYVKVGLPLQIIMGIVMVLVLPLLFLFLSCL